MHASSLQHTVTGMQATTQSSTDAVRKAVNILRYSLPSTLYQVSVVHARSICPKMRMPGAYCNRLIYCAGEKKPDFRDRKRRIRQYGLDLLRSLLKHLSYRCDVIKSYLACVVLIAVFIHYWCCMQDPCHQTA